MKSGNIKRLMAAALAAVLTVTGSISIGITAKADTCGGLEKEDLYEPGSDEVIRDMALHWAIRSTLNAVKARPKLTKELVGNKQVMNISYALCAHLEDFDGWEEKYRYWIEDLSGLEYATSAKMIEISFTNEKPERRIRDLSPLSGLTQLQMLILKQDGIEDIGPVNGLVNLKQLDLAGNMVSDVSAIAGLKSIQKISLESNKVTDISAAAGLETLEYLNISKNQITNLPDMSRLKKVYFFDASTNKLTNEDVAKISAMRGLKELNIQSNEAITDIKPLARLIRLEKDKTMLPAAFTAQDKEDLFAAIEVNKLFNKFNISKMKPSDTENAGQALEAYNALNDAQKAYFDEKRIKAAQENKKRVEEGFEPIYYEEYDEDGEAQPVLDRLEITVVDKNGKPMPGAKFIKHIVGDKEISADKDGMLVIVHQLNDGNHEPSVKVSGTDYVSVPEKFEYTVKDGKTYVVNGKRVNGFEKHQIMLIPKNEYVDKSDLKTALDSAEKVEEEYRYTAATYKTYADALKAAQTAYSNADATEGEVDTAAVNLTNAIRALQKTDVLTELKLIVKDANGNLFTKPFKFQVYEPGQKGTDKGSWNKESDADTGIAYLPASPAWQDGKKWTVDACFEELYSINTFDVEVGVKNGQRYYKTVNGQSVGPDYEGVVTATYHGKETPGYEPRKPDNTVLKNRIEKAKLYTAENYTENTFSNLQTAIQAAEAAADKTGAFQEDYNAAAADLKKAEDALTEQANTVELEKILDHYIGYTPEMYVPDTWNKYDAEYNAARKVYEDKNATQQQVDDAMSRLKAAEASLVLKTNKSALKKQLDEAKALNEEDYVSGYDVLQAAIAEAQKVYDKESATQSETDAAVKQLQDAVKGLEIKKKAVDYCDPGVFRALVKDEQGNPLKGVTFSVQTENGVSVERVKTGADGIFEHYVDGTNKGKKMIVRLSDKRYATKDEHSFVADGINQWVVSMVELDGKVMTTDSYTARTVKLTYTLTPTGIENPDPDDPDPDKPDPDDPNPGTVGKEKLKEEIDIAESMKNRGSDYTKESFGAMLTALEEAQKVYANADATADQISAAAQKLNAARMALKAVEKPIVTDKQQIRILVKDTGGKKVTDRAEFYIELGNNRPVVLLSTDGVLEYGMTDADQGVKQVTVFAPEDGVKINGQNYLVSPDKHEFTIDASSLGVFITHVDGKEIGDLGQEVTFIVEKDSAEEADKWTAECFTYDGGVLTGFSRIGKDYLAKNKQIIIPDKSPDGMPVTEIAAEVFKNIGIESVELPSSLTKIGESAFEGNDLKAVKIPDNITFIAKNAFAYNGSDVTLEVSSKEVLKYLKTAGLEGVDIKDNTPEEKPDPEKPDPEKPDPEKPDPEKPDPDKPQNPGVQNIKVTRISITGPSKKIAQGRKAALSASVLPANATNKKITWKSSNTKVATVNAKGVVTMKKKSGGKKVTITATAADGSGVSGSYKITSMKNQVKKVSITGAKSIKAGKSLKLKAKVSASKGANKKVAWTSSNRKYASVSASGKVKTYKAGKGRKVKITAKATDGSGKKKTVTIKIK